MSRVLVINAGSSSIKYQLIEAVSAERIATGLVERIGERTGKVVHRGANSELTLEAPIPDHWAGFAEIRRAFIEAGTPLESLDIAAVGHRVVQGGSEFVAPTLINQAVVQRILDLASLAPLHNPAHVQAIEAATETLPDVPHIAVFDTTFHQTIPEAAYTYAIDPAVASAHGVRKYGFHGISHQVVSRRTAEFLGLPLEACKTIVLHIGNGASVCAVEGGRSINTSMGLTPLAGLMMGTRAGDIDPGAILHLLAAGMDHDELDDLLNRRSGLKGMAGTNDMRDVRAAAVAGDASAALALQVYAQRIRHYLGAYLLELGGADAIVFTAGVGENHVPLRTEVCEELSWFGIEIDPLRNAAEHTSARRISTDDSRVAVLVVPTDEESEIALQAWNLITAA